MVCAASVKSSFLVRLISGSPAQIASPSPSGGRINIQFRRVECTPPQDLELMVDNNRGGSGWIRLQITVIAACEYNSISHSRP